MKKIVRYNGGTQSYYPCTEPTKLVIGMEYEVIYENDRGWQTDYVLRGIEGTYNSVWFSDVKASQNTYLAVSRTVPVVGSPLYCIKIEATEGKITPSEWRTSTVKEIHHMGNSIYQVETLNSIYIVLVG